MTLRLFVDTALAEGQAFALPPGAARHAQVRRVQPGEQLVLFDGGGCDWPAEVLAMGRVDVQVHVGAPVAVDRELRCSVTLAVGMPANERMDWLVEKATELGVARVQPLLCERSVLRLAGERAERKREHWQAVAIAAAEQCGRARVPRVEAPAALPAWLAAGAAEGTRWLLAPGAPPLHGRAGAAALCVLSGPEGGLTPAEEAAAAGAGFEPVGLGPRILRAETAPLVVLAWAALAG